MSLRKIFGALIARGEAVQQANLATQQALLGLTPDTDWRTVSSSAPNWQKLFLALCESPPEEMFLAEMIGLYGLRPNRGDLESSLFKIRMQVSIEMYRVDFLVNDKFIIEIDGKTYHSAPESIKRDLERDAYFSRNGFSTIRIPARAVFENSRSVAEGVIARICRTPNARPSSDNSQTKTSLSSVLNGAGKFFADVSDGVERRRVEAHIGEAPLAPQRKAFNQERNVLDRAVAIARRQIERQKYRAQSEDHAHWFDRAHPPHGPAMPSKPIAPFESPPPHPDNDMNQAIQLAFGYLSKDRENYFSHIRDELSKDSKLKKIVRDKLINDGRSNMWEFVS